MSLKDERPARMALDKDIERSTKPRLGGVFSLGRKKDLLEILSGKPSLTYGSEGLVFRSGRYW